MNSTELELSHVNNYVARKQHLLPGSGSAGVTQVTRDVVALHATNATGPYLSLWARLPAFQREMLDDALYEQREVVRVLCMRSTLHTVASDELAYFIQAFAEASDEHHRLETLLVEANLCQEKDARAYVARLNREVLDVLTKQGPSTVRTINHAVPELQTKIQHDVDKPYAGEFSIGSRLVPGLCAQGLIVRGRPRGTWRSNLYEYARLADWLPDVNPIAVSAQNAQTWLVSRYLAAFGPLSIDDIQWWTGFSKALVEETLKALKPTLMDITIRELGDSHLILASDLQQLQEFDALEGPYASLLPVLDPYIMGYRDRRRFLAEAHHAKVFDRAGNAAPTVWVNGRVVGVWGQRKEGSVTYGLFEPVSGEEHTLLTNKVREVENFLSGEFIPTRIHTPFTRALS